MRLAGLSSRACSSAGRYRPRNSASNRPEQSYVLRSRMRECRTSGSVGAPVRQLAGATRPGRRFTVASLRYARRALRNQCARKVLAPRLFKLGEHFIVPHSGHNKMLRVARSIGPGPTITPLFGVVVPRAAPHSGRCTRLEGQGLAMHKRVGLRPRWPMPAMPPASTSCAGQPRNAAADWVGRLRRRPNSPDFGVGRSASYRCVSSPRTSGPSQSVRS